MNQPNAYDSASGDGRECVKMVKRVKIVELMKMAVSAKQVKMVELRSTYQSLS